MRYKNALGAGMPIDDSGKGFLATDTDIKDCIDIWKSR
jgi:hypothetical protein